MSGWHFSSLDGQDGFEPSVGAAFDIDNIWIAGACEHLTGVRASPADLANEIEGLVGHGGMRRDDSRWIDRIERHVACADRADLGELFRGSHIHEINQALGAELGQIRNGDRFNHGWKVGVRSIHYSDLRFQGVDELAGVRFFAI